MGGGSLSHSSQRFRSVENDRDSSRKSRIEKIRPNKSDERVPQSKGDV